MTKYDSIQHNITKKRALIVIFVAVSIMIIDSTIVKYIAFSNKEFPTHVYVSIFIRLAIVFVGTVIVLLGFVKSKNQNLG